MDIVNQKEVGENEINTDIKEQKENDNLKENEIGQKEADMEENI